MCCSSLGRVVAIRISSFKTRVIAPSLTNTMTGEAVTIFLGTQLALLRYRTSHPTQSKRVLGVWNVFSRCCLCVFVHMHARCPPYRFRLRRGPLSYWHAVQGLLAVRTTRFRKNTLSFDQSGKHYTFNYLLQCPVVYTYPTVHKLCPQQEGAGAPTFWAGYLR